MRNANPPITHRVKIEIAASNSDDLLTATYYLCRELLACGSLQAMDRGLRGSDILWSRVQVVTPLKERAERLRAEADRLEKNDADT